MAALRQIVNGNVTDASDVNQYSTLFGKVGSTVSTYVYDVVNGYGADPTGSADATTAIQAAITDACTANNGGVVYIPAGVYKITATLNVTADCITVTGDGPGSGEVGKGTVLKVFTAFTGSSVIKFAQSPVVRPLGGCTLRNISINGNSNAGTNIDGVYFSVYEGRIDTVNVEYMSGVGIRTIGVTSPSWNCYDTRLTNIVSSRNTSHGVFFDTKSSDVWLVDGSIFYNVGDGMRVTSSGVHIHGIHSYSNQGHGVDLIQVSSVSIANGYHENNYKAGVYFDNSVAGSSSIRIVGNLFYGNGRGTDNTFSNVEVGTAGSFGCSATITGNVFNTDPANTGAAGLGRPKYGIDLPSGVAQNCVVSDNLIFGTYTQSVVHANGNTTAGTQCLITNNPGYNPVGNVSAPSVPASTVALNVGSVGFNVPATVYIKGGTVSDITIGSTSTGMTLATGGTATVRLMPGVPITMTYSVAPTWTWWLD